MSYDSSWWTEWRSNHPGKVLFHNYHADVDISIVFFNIQNSKIFILV